MGWIFSILALGIFLLGILGQIAKKEIARVLAGAISTSLGVACCFLLYSTLNHSIELQHQQRQECQGQYRLISTDSIYIKIK